MYERVAELLVKELGIEKGKIGPEATLESLGVDSLDVAEFILVLERTFKVEFPDDELEKLRTVGNIVAYLEAKAA